MTYGNYAGIASIIVLVAGYYMLASQRWRSDSTIYYWNSIVGCILMVISLIDNFNASAMAAQVIFIMISIYGVVRGRRTLPPRRVDP